MHCAHLLRGMSDQTAQPPPARVFTGKQPSTQQTALSTYTFSHSARTDHLLPVIALLQMYSGVTKFHILPRDAVPRPCVCHNRSSIETAEWIELIFA